MRQRHPKPSFTFSHEKRVPDPCDERKTILQIFYRHIENPNRFVVFEMRDRR